MMSDHLAQLRIDMNLIQSEIDQSGDGWRPAVDTKNRTVNELLEEIDEHADEIYHQYTSFPEESMDLGEEVAQIIKIVSMIRSKLGLPASRLWKTGA